MGADAPALNELAARSYEGLTFGQRPSKQRAQPIKCQLSKLFGLVLVLMVHQVGGIEPKTNHAPKRLSGRIKGSVLQYN